MKKRRRRRRRRIDAPVYANSKSYRHAVNILAIRQAALP
jgi:hypothetical protein